jgi:hypothetical protein
MEPQPTLADLDAALSAAAIACADKAREVAESGGYPVTAEAWAIAATELAYAAKGVPGALPARGGK